MPGQYQKREDPDRTDNIEKEKRKSQREEQRQQQEDKRRTEQIEKEKKKS
jgi:hypothetical protein